jgi:hypothetical protein
MKKTISIQLAIMIFVVMQATSQTGEMKVSPGTKVTLNQGSTIKIKGGGNLLLQDDLSTAPSFLQKGTLVFTGGGEAMVEQYLPKDAWHIVSSPVQEEVNGAYMWMYFYKYDEPSNAFVYMNQPVNQPLNPGQSYFVWAYTTDPNGTYPPSPDSAVLNGTLNYQSIDNYSLSYTASSSNPGWNLVGNPFPCSLDWNDSGDWDRVNTDATVYIYDAGSGGGSSGNYRTYNWNTGIGIPSGNDGIITTTQGFWLHANNTGARVDIPQSQRLHSSKPFYKSTDGEWENLLRLRMDEKNSTLFYETVIAFLEETTGSFAPLFDGAFLEGKDSAPAVFTVTGQEEYSVNFLPSYEDYSIVPLNFKATVNGEYSITASNIESFPGDLPVYLEDKKDDIYQNLRENPEYTFVWEIGDNEARFNVHFANPLGTEENDFANKIHIYAYDKTVYVNIPFEINGNIVIYNFLGETLINKSAQSGLNKIPVNQNNTYLIVKIISDSGAATGKVFIK